MAHPLDDNAAVHITVDDHTTPTLEKLKADLDRLQALAPDLVIDVSLEHVLTAPEFWANED